MKKTKENNFNLKAILGTITAIVLSLALFVFTNVFFPFKQWGPPGHEPADSLMYVFFVQFALSILMLVFSSYLVFIYLKDYLQLKSKFILGILLAIFSFMLFAIAANPALHVFLGVYGGKGVFQIVPYIFATISLAILVWVSSK